MGCINRGITSKSQDVIVLLYTALVRLHLKNCVQFWKPHFKKDVDKIERKQRRVMRMIQGLETKPCEERLRDLGMFSLEKRRLRRDMIAVFKYLTDCHSEEDRERFHLAGEDRTRSNGFK